MEKQAGEKLFREKSLRRVASPESLNEYIRVPHPGVWFFLLAVFFLFVGFFVWSVFGVVHTTVSAVAVSEGGQLVCYIPEAEGASVRIGMKIEMQGQDLKIATISSMPVSCKNIDPYVCHVGRFAARDWVYEARAKETTPDGIYSVQIITEKISPISFLWN